MKKYIFSILGAFLVLFFVSVLFNKTFATGYCPGYSSSKGNNQCFCYPVSVTATPNCNNGKATSITVNWNGANCQFSIYSLRYTDNGQQKEINNNYGSGSNWQYSTTISGTDITGGVSVSPNQSGGKNYGQFTTDNLAACPSSAPPTSGIVTGSLKADKTSFSLAPGETATATFTFTINGGPASTSLWFSTDDGKPVLSNIIANPTSSTETGTTPSKPIQLGHTYKYIFVLDPSDKVPEQPSNTILGTVTITTNAVPTPLPATANVATFFQAIDTVNNTKPQHQQRKLTLYFYPDNSYTSDLTGAHAAYKATDTLVFNNTNQNDPLYTSFINSQFNIGAIPSGSYYILAKSEEGSLRKLLSLQKIPITATTNNVIVNTDTSNGTPNIPSLLMGDINNDNVIDITDYSILVDCYGNKSTQSSCTGHNISDTTKGLFSDLNDDNVVDGIDYNILIRNYGANGN